MIKKLARQLSSMSKITCATILIVIIVLIGMEAILIPITKSKAWLKRPLASLNIMDEHYPVPPSYVDAVWFEDYRKEFKTAATFDWQPYLYWHTKPFVGKYIKVNENRTRKTELFKVKTASLKKKKKIFMFGGSTMWGWGVRDAYTIPSLVSKRLAECDISAEITNYGEIGFVSTQEVLRLIFQLQKGNIPDIVIFYNGLNDVYSALRTGQTGVVGVACDEFQRRNLFEGKYPVLRWIYENYIMKSGMFKMAVRLLNKDKPMPIALNSKQIETISENIFRVYRRNLEIIEALSKKYGFNVLYYWQPTIFTKRTLSDFEMELEKSAKTGLFNEFVFRSVNEKVKKIQHNTFQNISDILDTSTTYYIDFSHIDEKGNEIIAAKMADDLMKQVLDLR